MYRKRQKDIDGGGRSINSLHSLSDRAVSPDYSNRSAGMRLSECSDDADRPGRWERSGYSDYGESLGQEPAYDPRSFSEQAQQGNRSTSVLGSLSSWDNNRDAASPSLESSENKEEMKPFADLSDSHSDGPRCHHELSAEGFIEYEARGSSGRYMVDDRRPRSRYSSRGRDNRVEDFDDYYADRRDFRPSRSRSRSLRRRYVVKEGKPRSRYSSRERDNHVEDVNDYWADRREIRLPRSRSRTPPRGPIVSECWRKVYWDHPENEIPTSDCQIIRLTDYRAMIVTPVRKFGTVGTAKGCTGSLYTRVGMLEILVVREGMEKNFCGAYGEEFKPLFEFDWSDDQVVTVM